MDELISVELAGHETVFPLERSAHEELSRYFERARRRLIDNPDRDEILEDLERSVGTRLSQVPVAVGGRINAAVMTEVLTEVGDVDRETVDQPHHAMGAQPARGRFWCRIEEGKWFGGLCAGIAAYGNFRVDWVRTVFIFGGLVTGGLLGVAYLVALLIVPSVASVAEYERQRDAPRAEPRV